MPCGLTARWMLAFAKASAEAIIFTVGTKGANQCDLLFQPKQLVQNEPFMQLIIRKAWLVFWSGSPTVHQKQVGWRNWFFCLGLSPLSLFSPWKVANYAQNMLSCNLCYHQNPEWCHGCACGETGAGLRFSLVCKAGQLRVGRLVNPNPREFQQTGLEVQPCIIMLARLTSMWIDLEASPDAGFWKYRWNHNRTTCTGGRIVKLKIIW